MQPLVPAGVDLRDFAFMPVDVQRLLTSETWVLGNGDERAAAMTLWLVSWHQVPAGSLPDNDRMLSHLSQAKSWTKIKAHVMRGWLLADDGRYYHPVVAEKALEAWLEKLAQRLSSGAGNAKRWGAEFDPAPIEVEMIQTRALLAALNPQSRQLSKRRLSGVPSGSKDNPGGNPKSIPSGVPSGSQETGTGTGNKDQKQEPAPHAPSSPDTPATPPPTTDAGRACLLLRQAGCARVNPSNPDLLAALAEGVTPEAIRDTYAEKPNATNPFAWAITTARARHAEGPKPISTGPPRVNGTPRISATMQVLQDLEDAKNGKLDHPGNQLRIAEAGAAES
ncbi:MULTISPECIES: DUF1376 domain-containing protein [unclassified Rhodanobacter]|uniref:DUF1376 domain-containing protein n=1 Tax=unclassified Rhodanobacter TaxID=2621553 RepID=UPI0009ED61A3|nr:MULTISPECIES: DUF1376 domain-containing protein [unclassified Rhodanobacter]